MYGRHQDRLFDTCANPVTFWLTVGFWIVIGFVAMEALAWLQ